MEEYKDYIIVTVKHNQEGYFVDYLPCYLTEQEVVSLIEEIIKDDPEIKARLYELKKNN